MGKLRADAAAGLEREEEVVSALAQSPGAHHVQPVQIGFQSGQRDAEGSGRSRLLAFLQRWTINTLAVLVATHVVNGIHYDKDDLASLFVASLLFGVLVTFLRPLLLVLSLPLIFLALVIADTNAAVAVISLGSFFAALAGPCAYTITIDMGQQHVATVNSTMNMCGNLGAWAFPVAVPWLLKNFGGWDAVLVVFGGTYVLAAVFWLILNPNGNILDQSLIRPRTTPSS